MRFFSSKKKKRVEDLPRIRDDLEISLFSSFHLYEEVFKVLAEESPLHWTECGTQKLVVVNHPRIAREFLNKAKTRAPMNVFVDTIHHPVGEGAPPLHWLSKLTDAMSNSFKRFKERVTERPHLWNESFSDPLSEVVRKHMDHLTLGINGSMGLFCVLRTIFDEDVDFMHQKFPAYNELRKSIDFFSNNKKKRSMKVNVSRDFLKPDENCEHFRIFHEFCEKILDNFDGRRNSCMYKPTDDILVSTFFEIAQEQAWSKSDQIRALMIIFVSGYDVFSKAFSIAFKLVDLQNADGEPHNITAALKKLMFPGTVNTRPILFESDKDICLDFVERGKTISVMVPKGTLIMLNPVTYLCAPSAPSPFPAREISGSTMVHDLLEFTFPALEKLFTAPRNEAPSDTFAACEEFRVAGRYLPPYKSVVFRLLLERKVRSIDRR